MHRQQNEGACDEGLWEGEWSGIILLKDAGIVMSGHESNSFEATHREFCY